MDLTSGDIDTHRPWIRDHRDDPGTMNWAQTLLNPFGKSPKLHFTRAWTFSFLGRFLLYIVPSFAALVLAIAGMGTAWLNAPQEVLVFMVPALLVPFAAFVLFTEYTSFVSHTRRLADAGRPTGLAAIVLVPIILGLAAYAAGAQQGAAQHRELNAPPAAKVETEKEGEADAEAGAEKADTAAKDDGAKNKQQPQRRGPPGPPQSERQMAMSAGTGAAFLVWWLGSAIVMIWSLVWVGRLPNGGEGRIRTGSHLTPEEIATGL
jgi:uncharacterized membrane protein YhaH (DUF805 family)